MQYSPKLKKAMEEIKAVIVKYDIAAAVILHAPGNSEFLNHVNPSYSCMSFADDNLRIKTKGRSTEDIAATANMIHLFAVVCSQLSDVYFDAEDILKKYMDIDHTDGGMSNNTTQNN